MTIKKFGDYTISQHQKRDITQQIDEVQRETDVRRRIYDRWVADGKLSRSDAHDRLERQLSVWKTLIEVSNLVEAVKSGHDDVVFQAVREICLHASPACEQHPPTDNVTSAQFGAMRNAVQAAS